MSEFMQLWAELGQRFGIDIVANAKQIAFAEMLNKVRNQIIHEGGQANPELPLARCTDEAGDESYLDLEFSKAYPEYVEGSGQIDRSKRQWRAI